LQHGGAGQRDGRVGVARVDRGAPAYVALPSDLKFICGARRAARAAEAGQDAPVYRYPFAPDGDASQPNNPRAAFHGLEPSYIFASWDALLQYEPNADDLTISPRRQAAWARFATTGDRAGADLSWPVAADDNGALLDESPDLFNGVRTEQRDLGHVVAVMRGRTSESEAVAGVLARG
jgi:carboxylesterase type B